MTCQAKGKYRVTHQVVQNLPLTSKQKFHFGIAASGTFVLKSMGGFALLDVSPCSRVLMDPCGLGGGPTLPYSLSLEEFFNTVRIS